MRSHATAYFSDVAASWQVPSPAIKSHNASVVLCVEVIFGGRPDARRVCRREGGPVEESWYDHRGASGGCCCGRRRRGVKALARAGRDRRRCGGVVSSCGRVHCVVCRSSAPPPPLPASSPPAPAPLSSPSLFAYVCGCSQLGRLRLRTDTRSDSLDPHACA